jgi:hypothetical protein
MPEASTALARLVRWWRLQCETFGTRFMVFLCVCNVLAGCFSEWYVIFVAYYLKDDVGFEPSETQNLLAIVDMGSWLRPVLGMLSDSVPLLGSNRLSYFLLTNIGGALCYVYVCLVDAPSVYMVGAMLFGSNLLWSWSFLLLAAMVVEAARLDSDPQRGAANLTSIQWGMISLGYMLGDASAGILYDATCAARKCMLLILAHFVVMAVAAAFCVPEDNRLAALLTPCQPSRRTAPGGAISTRDFAKGGFKENLARIWTVVNPNGPVGATILKPIIFIVLSVAVIPDTYYGATYYFYTQPAAIHDPYACAAGPTHHSVCYELPESLGVRCAPLRGGGLELSWPAFSKRGSPGGSGWSPAGAVAFSSLLPPGEGSELWFGVSVNLTLLDALPAAARPANVSEAVALAIAAYEGAPVAVPALEAEGCPAAAFDEGGRATDTAPYAFVVAAVAELRCVDDAGRCRAPAAPGNGVCEERGLGQPCEGGATCHCSRGADVYDCAAAYRLRPDRAPQGCDYGGAPQPSHPGHQAGDCHPLLCRRTAASCNAATHAGGLGFSATYWSFLAAEASFWMIVGSAVYTKFLPDVSLRRIIVAIHVLYFASGIFDIGLALRWNDALGVNAEVFAGVDQAVFWFVWQLKTIPLYTLATTICPPGVEGTMTAIIIGLRDVGYSLAKFLGAGMTDALGITSVDFTNIWLLYVIRMFQRLLPAALVFLVPAQEEINEAIRVFRGGAAAGEGGWDPVFGLDTRPTDAVAAADAAATGHPFVAAIAAAANPVAGAAIGERRPAAPRPRFPVFDGMAATVYAELAGHPEFLPELMRDQNMLGLAVLELGKLPTPHDLPGFAAPTKLKLLELSAVTPRLRCDGCRVGSPAPGRLSGSARPGPLPAALAGPESHSGAEEEGRRGLPLALSLDSLPFEDEVTEEI